MKILIATDAWHPQINGVVRSLEQTATALTSLGVDTEFLTPAQFRSVPLPTYPEIRLALAQSSAVFAHVEAGAFDAVHIATEGPVGHAARRACRRNGLAFTTSYHTRFPEYLRARAPVPQKWTYAWLRRFHKPVRRRRWWRRNRCGRSSRSVGSSTSMLWSRGVDTDLFRPRAREALDLPRPIFLYVGRLAVEKNIEAFLDLDLPGTKVVVGDGPHRANLAARYREAVFLGARTGESLAGIYASADVFVFPSRTDTFGIVLLEALASGLPVAGFPVPGPAGRHRRGDGRRSRHGPGRGGTRCTPGFPHGLPRLRSWPHLEEKRGRILGKHRAPATAAPRQRPPKRRVMRQLARICQAR